MNALGSRGRLVWRRLFRHQQWNIGIVDRPIHTFLGTEGHPEIRWFPLKGRDAFLADPFGRVDEAGATILCEHYDYRGARGTIRRIRVENGRFVSPLEPALELPTHLSYPFLVEEDGVVYCLPEARAHREIALFRATSFPTSWTQEPALVADVVAVDPTLVSHGGRWWLMCVDGEGEENADLLVWHAPALRGPWVAHRANPVKSDAGSARPAGTPFEHEGRLYRPAQDCSDTYGARIVINEVTRLTPEDYAEEQVAVIEPSADSPYPAGRHTLSALGDMTLIDGHRFVFVGVALRQFVGILARDLLRRLRDVGPR